MVLEQYLQKIGLSDKESRLYLTGLQTGPATIQDLARASGIKRTTIYEIVDGLVAEGLFFVTPKNKRKYYAAQDPENLILFLKQKENILAEIMPELSAIVNSKAQKPNIRVFDGLDGIKQIYDDMIKKPGEIYAMAAPKDKISLMVLNYLKEVWEPSRIKEKIPLKRININYKSDIKDYQRVNVAEELEEIYYLPQENYPFSVGIYAYRQKVAFVSFHAREMVGIIIRSPEINWTIKMMFNFFWQNNSKNHGRINEERNLKSDQKGSNQNRTV